MNRICEGRVAVITGGGRGLGRAYALELARQGAKVVVNDLGGSRDGKGAEGGPAQEVVAEIRAMGGEAIANHDDVSDFDGAGRLIQSAISEFGGLDALINNAGILRDRMLVNMSLDEWDDIIKVHMRGTFGPLRHAAAYWREESKAGRQRQASVVNTSSSSGLFAKPGQANYGAAKSGIATLSLIAAQELARFGVSVNAIYPYAMSRLTEDIFAKRELTQEDRDRLEPDQLAPVIVWLCSSQAAHVTGQVFGVRGGQLELARNWHISAITKQESRWQTAAMGPVIDALLERGKASEPQPL